MWSVFSLTTDLCQQQHVISCWVVNVNDTPNYSIKKILTMLNFSSLDGTVSYTVSATWECLEHSACVTESLVVLPCLKISLIWHTKVKEKSNWSIKTYIKADHKCECGMIKTIPKIFCKMLPILPTLEVSTTPWCDFGCVYNFLYSVLTLIW